LLFQIVVLLAVGYSPGGGLAPPRLWAASGLDVTRVPPDAAAHAGQGHMRQRQ